MKRCLLLLLLISPMCVWADASSHRKAVDELMQVLHAEGQLVSLRKQLDAQAIEVINKALDGKTEAQLNEAERHAIDRFSQRANASLDAALDWKRFRDSVAQIYLESYSEGEVRDLLGFYRSVTGQKSLQQSGRIADALGHLLRTQIQSTLPEFQRIGQEFNLEYERARSLPISAPSPKMPERKSAATAINPKTGR